MLKLTAFSLRDLGNMSTMLVVAERNNISDIASLSKLVHGEIESRRPKDKRSIAKKRLDRSEQEARNRKLPKCSVCGQGARLLPVNDSPGTQVGGDYKSCTVCYNQECKNVDYFNETVQELMKKAK